MANPMSSIGTGISISGRAQEYIPLLSKRMERDAAEKSAKKKSSDKEVDWKDFEVTDKTLYPRYARAAADLHAEVANKFIKLTAAGMTDQQAMRKIQMDDLPSYREKLGNIYVSNSNAKKILSDDKNYYDPEFRKKLSSAVMSSEYDPNQFATEFNRPDMGVTATNGLVINADEVQDLDFGKMARDLASKKENQKIDREKIVLSRPVPNSPGDMLYEYPTVVNDDVMEAMANDIVGDPKALELYRRKYRSSIKDKNADFDNMNIDMPMRNAIRVSEIKNFLYSQIPKTYYERGKTSYTIDKPTAEEKKAQVKVSGNKVSVGNTVWSYYVNPNGDEEFTMSNTDIPENKEYNFVIDHGGGNRESIVGSPRKLIIKKGQKEPQILVDVKEDEPIPQIKNGKILRYEKDDNEGNKKGDIVYQTDPVGNVKYRKKVVERLVNYEDNADKLANEFKLTPYEVRQKVRGSLERGNAGETGKATAGKPKEVKVKEGKTILKGNVR